MEQKLYNGDVTIKFNEGNHSYYVNGKRVKSVTGIVNMLENPALSFWKLNCAKEYINDLLKKNIDINYSHVDEAIKYHEKIADEAKTIGTAVHDYCEAFAIAHMNGSELPSIPNVDDKIINGINAFLEWVGEHNIEFLKVENIIYSKKYNYVGKFDLLCKIDGKLTLVDYKTSKGIYENQDWQLTGYDVAYKEEFGDMDIDLLLLHFDKESGIFTPHYVVERKQKEEIFKTMAYLKNLL